MLRETALFDALHSELAIALEETRDDEIDADRVAARLLENDGARRLLIGIIEGAIAVDLIVRRSVRTILFHSKLVEMRDGQHVTIDYSLLATILVL
ncbi:hypothetical protein SAMN05421858_3369 [Haladaptatus litoreus]|uniref:Uncharacterized protein n=1 Tax=Haladaptatus litoreus TaxID=553468 RepID=A0A1N7D092_9EURY|nr:hypothetical protein [Haladaptatus litoreus]SIR69115.1 hypothetical protein SAMN05421858_3369 [Haladaptatus litoreus]